ncbi:class I SAM-dependent methyltransferase [Lacibacterium aquatile]|uniref:Class I SAM-dependent methyltransferase n=1 Tax=Lacibacterium aquatile TaxID=1168082 RepID=A0ABW5DTC9_9PROT
MDLDTNKLQALLGLMVTELGAAHNAALTIIGDELGLYRAMAEAGPLDSTALANVTGTNERYIREWLSAQAASGFISYNPATQLFSLSPEQTLALAVDDSPVNVVGAFVNVAATYSEREQLTQAFKTGGGVAWKDRCSCLFCGTDRFFRTGYRANLVAEWLPQLDGVVAKLEKGAKVVDVGCGFGSSTLIMAQAFPKSDFLGVDFHGPSIDHARQHGAAQDNLRFEVGRAQDFHAGDADLVAFFDALHDMGDPVGAARHALECLKPDGTLMLVEPMAGDTLAENMNPVGRIYYAASTTLCVPAALSQDGGEALGAQAGYFRLEEVLREAGFTRIRRAAASPFNMVIEARK